MIYTMHGVVRSHNKSLLAHQWMTDIEAFGRFLFHRPAFVSLREALLGSGDALTIDDATQAAFDAAIMARQHGHEVTLFVNSTNVQDNLLYFFHLLSAILDEAPQGQLRMLHDRWAPTDGAEDKFIIRRSLKHRMSRIPSEQARQKLIAEMTSDLRLFPQSTPGHLITLSNTQLKKLHAEGVSLENHGANHVDYSVLDETAIQDDIAECRAWLLASLKVDAQYFAVPFGNVIPRWEFRDEIAKYWFTDNRMLQGGFIGPKVYNRLGLSI
jgi:hypothetical protein